MVNEIGTLKELNVKRGDVVELIKSPDYIHVGTVCNVNYNGDAVNKDKNWTFCHNYDDCFNRKYRIISRASDTTKTWGEMTDDEKFPFLLDWSDNKAENVQQWNGSEWIKMRTGRFGSVIAYRIKPETKRETVKRSLHGSEFMGYVAIDIVDGNVDWESMRKWND